jgi:hypothetical protein
MEFLVIMAVMYFLPMIVALAKGCDSKGPIIAISLLLGWFPLVSIICLIWAIAGKTEQKQIARAEILADAIAAAQRRVRAVRSANSGCCGGTVSVEVR